MAACPICGLELAGAPKQCLACNADLASAGALMGDILGPAPTPRTSAPAKPAEKARIDYKKVVVAALLWGWACAGILGVIAGILMHLVIGDEGEYAALKAGLNFGGMLGFLAGSIWGVTSTLELEFGTASLLGGVLGAIDTTIHYYGESILIAPPDVAAYLYSLMGCGAGAIAGAFSVALRNYRDNA